MNFNFERKSKEIFFTLSLIVFLLMVFPGMSNAGATVTNWMEIAKAKPDLKVMVLIQSQRPFSLGDLASLAQSGLVPADRDPALVLGLNRTVFTGRLKNWVSAKMPIHLKGRLLDIFVMSGIYRVGFEVVQPGYEGPLNLEVTSPRDGFGKQLLSSEWLIRPRTAKLIQVDKAGNRWACVNYAKVRQGEVIKFIFAFKYLVDVSALLQHDLLLVKQTGKAPIPEEVKPFLVSGHKINLQLPQIIDWVWTSGVFPGDTPSEYLRVKNYLKKAIAYDNRKKARYFGGKAVYSDLDDMYQDIPVTLSQRLGACPDTSLVECAFLRARGIPCRTAGRVGHFLTHLYVPGLGWMSTLINPTGIPLITAPGPDHIPYQKWKPSIQLRTVTLETKIKIDPPEDLP